MPDLRLPPRLALLGPATVLPPLVLLALPRGIGRDFRAPRGAA